MQHARQRDISLIWIWHLNFLHCPHILYTSSHMQEFQTKVRLWTIINIVCQVPGSTNVSMQYLVSWLHCIFSSWHINPINKVLLWSLNEDLLSDIHFEHSCTISSCCRPSEEKLQVSWGGVTCTILKTHYKITHSTTGGGNGREGRRKMNGKQHGQVMLGDQSRLISSCECTFSLWEKE